MRTFKVEGMTCGHCERAVTAAVRAVDADATVAVDREAGIVRVDGEGPADRMIAAIEAEGYSAQLMPTPPNGQARAAAPSTI